MMPSGATAPGMANHDRKVEGEGTDQDPDLSGGVVRRW